MNFKIYAAAILAVFSLIGAAAGADISFDTSGIPETAVAGETYIVPVTVSGDDVSGFTFVALYDEGDADVHLSNTGNMMPGGFDGKRSLISYTGPGTFNVEITPKSDGSVKLKVEEVIGNNTSSPGSSVEIRLNVSSNNKGSGFVSGSVIKEPSASPSARASEPTPEKTVPGETVKEQTTTSEASPSPSESVSEKSTASPATQPPSENKDSGSKSLPAPGIVFIAGSLAVGSLILKRLKNE